MDGSPLIRFYYDNRRHLPGLVIIVALSLVSGVLKTLSATYWGRAVDLGVAGLIGEMLTAAGFMALFILLDCARTALHYRLIGRITEDMFLEVRARAFQSLTHADPAILEEHCRTGDAAVRLNGDKTGGRAPTRQDSSAPSPPGISATSPGRSSPGFSALPPASSSPGSWPLRI